MSFSAFSTLTGGNFAIFEVSNPSLLDGIMAGDAIQMVLHRGAQITTGTAFYQAVSAHTSSEANKPGVGTVWAAIENWDVGQMIARLDYRAWANLMYQAAFDHTAAVANRPDMSSISLGFAPVWDRIPDWLTSVSYLLNEYVQYTDDKTYRAIAAHLSTTENDPLEPDVAAVPSVPAFTSPWTAQALWAAGENYVIGDAIVYNAALYAAITAHLSSLLNNPSVPDRAPVAGYTSPWDEAVDVIGVWQPGQSIVVGRPAYLSRLRLPGRHRPHLRNGEPAGHARPRGNTGDPGYCRAVGNLPVSGQRLAGGSALQCRHGRQVQ